MGADDDRQIAAGRSGAGSANPAAGPDRAHRTAADLSKATSGSVSSTSGAGRERKAAIIEALPDGYSFEGRRVLDFGCGSGRVLHEFLPEAASGEFWGCDLHRPTIAWLDQHLSPPLHFYVNDEIPTPHPDGVLRPRLRDLRVHPHHPRVERLAARAAPNPEAGRPPAGDHLRPRLGAERSAGRRTRTGSGCVCKSSGNGPVTNSSGARVLHSPWWLRSHWGRAFEILSLRSSRLRRSAGTASYWDARRTSR